MIILKINFFHVTYNPNIGIEPKFQDPTMYNAKVNDGQPKFDVPKCGKSYVVYLDIYTF